MTSLADGITMTNKMEKTTVLFFVQTKDKIPYTTRFVLLFGMYNNTRVKFADDLKLKGRFEIVIL